MNAIGVNTWIWVSPLTDQRLGELAPKIQSWGFDLIELPVEEPSDWDPARARSCSTGWGWAATVSRLVESLRPLADYAGQRGVRLAVEPLNRFETSLINTAEQAIEVVDRVGSPALGVLLDTFHMNIEERDPATAIRGCAGRLTHLHACGCDRGAPGGDHIGWPAIAAALDESATTATS